MKRISHKSTYRLQRHWRVLLLLPLCCLMQTRVVLADDVAAPTQNIGDHSTVATTDGSIRDDELIDFICEQINDNGGKVKDVKLMVNSCYGGGLLDDMERAFGSGGACEGIPWVGGSASGPEETARGHVSATVDNNPDQKLGSTWTDGLAGNSSFNKQSMAGVIRNGSASNNVLQDLQTTGQNDLAGPNGLNKEAPQVASGNSGDQIQWNMEGAKHEAVVFGGLQTDQRHHNNIENVETALNNTWMNTPHTIQAIDGGTTTDLKNAIETAAGRLDENTQLVIYIDDHGGSSFDFDEAIGAIANILIEDEVSWTPDIPDGWIQGLWGNYFAWPSELPTPTFNLDINQCDNCSNWGYLLNGNELPFPGGNRTGMVKLPVDFHTIRPGLNRLEIVPRQSSSTQRVGARPQTHNGSLVVSRMELSTGPINELTIEQLLLPGQSAAFFDPDRNGEGIFVELLDNQLALVYIFSYNREGTGQAWMIGLGEQVGEGIIIHKLFKPTGASFGPDFDPNDVVRANFGSLVFKFPTCGTSELPGILMVYPEGTSNYDLLESHNYTQLTRLVSCDTAEGSANSTLSGSWFDPTHDGEGIILQVLESGIVLVQWFTYDNDGNQMWIQGTGTITGNVLTVDNLFTTQGPEWGDGFDPDKVTIPDWGVLTMEFTGCGVAVVNYDSSAGFGVGTLNMVRLTNLMGITCVE